MAAITINTQYNDALGQGALEMRPASDINDALVTYSQELRRMRTRTDAHAMVSIFHGTEEIRRVEFSQGMISKIDPEPLDIHRFH